AASRELAEIIASRTAEDRRFIVGLEQEQLIRLHHGVGTRVRNDFRGNKLPALRRWAHSQLPESSALSFDALSYPILAEIWRALKGA
ncbi:MAG TPA: hypothetical protein VHV26_09355, partial [Rhizomicrobium sp.]|nr:hypothetical protein [Rhizomicrobium sp.]